jgi:hypothetical protein
VTPEEISPAIARLEMITAAAETDEDIAEVQNLLGSFEDDEAGQRELVRVLAVDVVEKLPATGGALAIRDPADFLAFGLLQAVERLNPLGVLETFVWSIPPEALSDLAAALVVFWHEACLQAAAAALLRVSVPEHAPEEI